MLQPRGWAAAAAPATLLPSVSPAEFHHVYYYWGAEPPYIFPEPEAGIVARPLPNPKRSPVNSLVAEMLLFVSILGTLFIVMRCLRVLEDGRPAAECWGKASTLEEGNEGKGQSPEDGIQPSDHGKAGSEGGADGAGDEEDNGPSDNIKTDDRAASGDDPSGDDFSGDDISRDFPAGDVASVLGPSADDKGYDGEHEEDEEVISGFALAGDGGSQQTEAVPDSRTRRARLRSHPSEEKPDPPSSDEGSPSSSAERRSAEGRSQPTSPIGRTRRDRRVSLRLRDRQHPDDDHGGQESVAGSLSPDAAASDGGLTGGNSDIEPQDDRALEDDSPVPGDAGRTIGPSDPAGTEDDSVSVSPSDDEVFAPDKGPSDTSESTGPESITEEAVPTKRHSKSFKASDQDRPLKDKKKSRSTSFNEGVRKLFKGARKPRGKSQELFATNSEPTISESAKKKKPTGGEKIAAWFKQNKASRSKKKGSE